MDGMTDIGKRIRLGRQARSWDMAELARQASRASGKTVSKQTISKLESAENPTENPTRKTLEGIAAALGTTTDFILTGREPARVAEPLFDYPQQAVRPAAVSPSETPAGYVRLQLLDVEGGMGDGGLQTDYPEVLRHVDVAEAWARARLPRDLERIRIITGRGDSNAPLINDGDILFVDVGIQHFAGEGMYVFNWMGHLLCKRLSPNLVTGRLEIRSVNKNYETTEVAANELDQLHIAGKVVAWWTLRTH